MKTLEIVIIIAVIVLVLFLLLSQIKKNKRSIIFPNEKLKSVLPNDSVTANIKTVYTELTTSINNLLKIMGNIKIPSDQVQGTLDNLNLKDIVSGNGEQNITNSLPPLKYEYKNLILNGFTKTLKFSGTQLKVDDISDNSQTLTLYMTAKASQLQCLMEVYAHMSYGGAEVNGNCSNSPIIFSNVVCKLEIQVKLTNCDKFFSNISSIILSNMDITFEKAQIYCDVALNLFNLFNFQLNNLNITQYLLNTINSNIPRIKNALAPLFNSQFKNINIPSLPCFNLGTGCLPGIDIKPNNSYRPTSLKDITWDECVDLCNKVSNCNYSYFNFGQSVDKRGTCVFYETKSKDLVAGGDYYDKKKNTIVKRQIPFPVKQSQIPGTTDEFGNIECGQVCKSNEECRGFTFQNGLCSMYRDADLQNFTVDLSKCERNVNNPNLFK
jgi:hypothetical protein